MPWREQVFLSWAGLRGAVPIVLATFPIVAGVPDSMRLLNIVFILVVVYTLIQGPSLRPLAHRLGLIPREATREIQVEAAPLDVLEAELLTMTVHPPSRLHNVTVLELRLPDPSVITLIIRDGHTFVPQPEPVSRRATNCSSSPPPRRGGSRAEAPCGESPRQARLLVQRVRRTRLTRLASQLTNRKVD